LHVALDAAEGLAALHAAGLCHRDVKPANLLFDHEGRIRLADFGLAVEEQQDEELRPRAVAGTPCYMAPELFRGAIASPQTDLYGLGATLYHLVTGWPPHDAPDQEQLIYAIVNHPFPDPRAHAPWLDDDVAELILRLGAKRCEERYASARELCEDIERQLRRSPPLHDPQTRAVVARIAPAWSAYVYHDGEGDEGLYEELRRLLHREMRPVEISHLATTLGAGQPNLIVYDVHHDSDSAVAWTRWMLQQAPSAIIVVILRRRSLAVLSALQALPVRIIVPQDSDPASIVSLVFSAVSTSTEGESLRPGFPPLPAITDVVLTRVVVLANRVDCGDAIDAERFVRSCAGLAGQLAGGRQFFARQLVVAMMRCVQQAPPEARERIRQLLARAARLLEWTHRGCDLWWERLEILVIDADPAAAMAVASQLQRFGVSARLAPSAEEALRLAAERLPQLVITDIAALHGSIELIGRLRRLPGAARLPILFLTGIVGFEEFFQRAAHQHCDIVATPAAAGELWLRCLVLLGEARWARLALSSQALSAG
ncbi:MAG: serine/threonine-protein kinase, partial [Planctomycetes bacterium]|nr:serine/threonine-protein kinase [Planctomycetota bacterium]